jgi:hypothetical protein
VHCRRLEYPIRLKPINDVVVTRYTNELPFLAAREFLDCVRANLRYLAVYHAGEFVYDNRVRQFNKAPRQFDAELFAVAEHVVRSKPCRNRVETDGLARRSDSIHRQSGREVIDNGFAAPFHRRVIVFSEAMPRYGRFPAARPTFQSSTSIGSSPCQRSAHFSDAGTSNMASNWRARGVRDTAVSTTRSMLGT